MIIFNLQLFADGEGQAEEAPATQEVVYGKQPHEETRLPELDQEVTDPETADLSAEFESMIKGDYKEQFDNRVKQILDKRFKNMDAMKNSLAAQQPIIDALASKYGVDPGDVKALSKAIEEDESFYEQEALEKGLTVKQLKEIKRLERDNELMAREIREQEDRANGERQYAAWLEEAEQFKEEYGLDFDLAAECQNPDFLNLLSNGISVEDAYMAIHHKEVIGNAMATTAAVTRQKVARNVASRTKRPSENGLKAQPPTVVKNDVNSLTSKDLAEIRRRVEEGETISF